MPNSDAGLTGAGLGSSRRSSRHLTKDAPETLEVVDRQHGSTKARTRIDGAEPRRSWSDDDDALSRGPVGLPWRYVPFVTAAAEFGRQCQARYNFRGAAAELEATVPLTSDEQVLLTGVARLLGSPPASTCGSASDLVTPGDTDAPRLRCGSSLGASAVGGSQHRP